MSEQNRSLQIARLKQLLGLEPDRTLFHWIDLDLLLDGSCFTVSNFDHIIWP
jgi:hypothetical protein